MTSYEYIKRPESNDIKKSSETQSISSKIKSLYFILKIKIYKFKIQMYQKLLTNNANKMEMAILSLSMGCNSDKEMVSKVKTIYTKSLEKKDPDSDVENKKAVAWTPELQLKLSNISINSDIKE